MITCEVRDLRERALQRGYRWEEVSACIVGREGRQIVVDTDHPAYPREQRGNPIDPFENGPGTELKKMLAKIGIEATPNCTCNAKAKIMNFQGTQWCRDNLETVVGWLREEAQSRGLPFLDAVGRILVKTAIRRAEQKKGLKRDRAGHK